MELTYDVVNEQFHEFCENLFSCVGVQCDFVNNSRAGGYNHIRNKVTIGYKGIHDSQLFGVVNPVDYISVYKQCFHEYRHFMQYDKMFVGKDNCGLSDDFICLMAEQAMIADIFFNYVSPHLAMNNYLKASYEIDAEEYAVRRVREYLSDKMSLSVLDRCICESINQRHGFWWGCTPIYSVDDAIDDLHSRKFSCEHLMLNDEVDLSALNTFSLTFMQNAKLLHEYCNLPTSEQNKYLIQYICRNAGGISKYYPVIADEFPKVESQKSRLSRLKESFGEITGLYDDVPDIQSDVSGSRPLPSFSEHMSDDGDYGNSGPDV